MHLFKLNWWHWSPPPPSPDTEPCMLLPVRRDADDLSVLNYTPSASAGSHYRKIIMPHITNMWLSEWAFRIYDKGAGCWFEHLKDYCMISVQESFCSWQQAQLYTLVCREMSFILQLNLYSFLYSKYTLKLAK